MSADAQTRRHARALGMVPGVLPPGPLNAITDVAGVRVGHVTLVEGADVRTGVTAILPHPGNLFQEKTPAGLAVGNGFGKFTGSTQIVELGEIETPIVLTNTLAVPQAAAALIAWTLAQPGNEAVVSVNPVVGETNDSRLNDIRHAAVTAEHVLSAIAAAQDGPVAEGSVGAGTGTVAFGWKGGIGTASRKTGEYTTGVLVQSNFGGTLRMCGASFPAPSSGATRGGSIMMVVATDAPVDARQLERMAARTIWGLARTGSNGSNGSGDYGIAFTTHQGPPTLSNDQISPLFEAVIEATEEAILNSLTQAQTVTSNGRTVQAIPLDRVRRAFQN